MLGKAAGLLGKGGPLLAKAGPLLGKIGAVGLKALPGVGAAVAIGTAAWGRI